MVTRTMPCRFVRENSIRTNVSRSGAALFFSFFTVSFLLPLFHLRRSCLTRDRAPAASTLGLWRSIASSDNIRTLWLILRTSFHDSPTVYTIIHREHWLKVEQRDLSVDTRISRFTDCWCRTESESRCTISLREDKFTCCIEFSVRHENDGFVGLKRIEKSFTVFRYEAPCRRYKRSNFPSSTSGVLGGPEVGRAHLWSFVSWERSVRSKNGKGLFDVFHRVEFTVFMAFMVSEKSDTANWWYNGNSTISPV